MHVGHRVVRKSMHLCELYLGCNFITEDRSDEELFSSSAELAIRAFLKVQIQYLLKLDS